MKPVREQGGFTLIELMIVVVVVAILAAVAYPSYREHVIKTRRAAAAGCLHEHAQLLERHFATRMTYATAPAFAGQCVADLAQYYTFAAVPAARTFTLSATPTANQPDTKCAVMGLDQAGTKTKTGTASTAEECF